MKNVFQLLVLIPALLSGMVRADHQEARPPALRAAAEPDYPPFSIVNADGTADGLAVELLQEALSVMDRTASFKSAPWDQIKNELATGELDVLPLVGRTPEREDLYDFTVPYLTLHGALFVRDDESRIHSLADLPGKRIAVMKGDNAEEYVLRAKLSDQIISTTSFDAAFRMLAAGEADAVVAQKLMGVSLLNQLGLRHIKVVGRPNDEFRQAFCFAVKKGNAELLAELNEGLALVVANGTQRRLMSKWLGTSETSTARARVLIYGDDAAYPPYVFLDQQGRPSGFQIELLRAISATTGIDIAFQLEPWSEVRRKMTNGELDMTSMFYTPQRDRFVDFSLPHSEMYAAVFTRTGAPAYQSIDDLDGRRVAVQNGDRLHEYALAQGWGDTLIITESLEESLALLEKGNVDFSLGYHIAGLHWITENNWKNIHVAEAHLMKTEYCFAVQEGNRELLNLLNDGLLQLKKTGKYQAIYHQWLGGFEKTKQPLPLWFWMVICGVGGIAVLLFGANRLLRHQVNQRTAELRQSEEQFRSLAESMPQIVWATRADGWTIYFNQQWVDYTGMTLEESYGHGWNTPFHSEDRENAWKAWEQATKNNTSYSQECRLRRFDGTYRWWLVRGVPQLNAAGETVKWYGTCTDIEQIKQAEKALKKSEAEFRSTLADLQVGVVVHNADSSIVLSNLQAQHILGLTADQISGKTIVDPDWSFAHEDLSVMEVSEYPVSRAIATKERVSNITLGVNRPELHKIIWILVNATPVFTEQHKLSRVIVNFIDITDQKMASENLRSRNEELARFNKAAVGRELRMMELKEEVNALCHQLGRKSPYPLVDSTGDIDETASG
jgi:two-component system sensor histidine kinase EvgS